MAHARTSSALSHLGVQVLRDTCEARSRVPWAEELRVWIDDVECRLERGAPVSAAEYLTGAHLVRNRVLESPRHAEASDQKERLRALVVALREALGAGPARSSTPERLPRRLLAREPQDLRMLHDLIFAPAEHAYGARLLSALDAYEPRLRDLEEPARLLLCAAAGGLPMLAAYGAGRLYEGLAEHVTHDIVGHATPKDVARVKRICDRFGRVGQVAFESYIAFCEVHKLHHRIFRKYNKPVSPERASQWVSELSPRGQRLAAKTENGLRPNLIEDWRNHVMLAAGIAGVTLTPIYLAATGLGLNPSAVSFAVKGALAAVLGGSWVVASETIHPRLHGSRSEALGDANLLQRWQLTSRRAARLNRTHAMHHVEVEVNLGLSTFVGDFVMGTERNCSVAAYLSLIEHDQIRYAEPNPFLFAAWRGARNAIEAVARMAKRARPDRDRQTPAANAT
ncbi:MAG: hypothetical protein AAGJ56_02820 [Myxococcota bacterium]